MPQQGLKRVGEVVRYGAALGVAVVVVLGGLLALAARQRCSTPASTGPVRA
jgi:hypothetical protein